MFHHKIKYEPAGKGCFGFVATDRGSFVIGSGFSVTGCGFGLFVTGRGSVVPKERNESLYYDDCHHYPKCDYVLD